MTDRVIGHYRILEKIGEGAMGEVFRARDENLHRDVAIKLIRPDSSEKPDRLRRFEREARAAASLSHPNILAIYDFGVEGTTPYIVSELLKGMNLRATLANGPLPVEDAIGYAQQILSGLTAAHSQNIVHRDLKPENIFLNHDGLVKILDFGVAKLHPSADEDRPVAELTTITSHRTILGTFAYMSPEQLRAQPVDARSDIFSFGAVFYEMLTGHRAFIGQTDVDTMTAVLKEEPARSTLDEAAVPTACQEIVRHCLEKDLQNRFQSVKDLSFALQAVSGASPGTTTRVPQAKRWRPGILPWIVAAVIALAALILAGVQMLRPAPGPPAYKRVTFEAGTVYAARFSPNGESIVYSAAWDGNAPRLFSTVGSSALSQPLEFTNANLLGISGKNELALVIHGVHSGQLETLHGILARAPLAGGAPREVLPEVRWADWDSSGELAIVHSVDGRSRLEYPVGKVLYESPGWISNIRFSPHGDSIAFIDHPALWDNRGAVRTVDLSGQLRTLTNEWASASGLAWRPDGREVWFTAAATGYNLNLMAVSLTGKVRLVLVLPMAITLEDIAPDGQVLVSMNSKRLAVAFATLADKQDLDLSWHDWNPARDIAPDGSFVLFEDSSEAAGPDYAVVIRKVDGSLPVSLGDGSPGALSPDGKWVMATSPSKAREITLLPIGAGEPRSIAVSGLEHIQNGWARFLPDGQQVIVNGDVKGNAPSCYVVDLSTGKARPVTPEGTICGPVSPDGRSLIGVTTGKSIAIYLITGGQGRTIPHVESNFVPVQWSDDGSSLYGFHPGEFPSRVLKFNIATGNETVVRELKPSAPAGVVNVSPVVVSRDGQKFAYSYNQTLSVLYVISGLN
jgi:serine/threonine protein kinase/Tol biopolymer transport system component